MSTHWLFISIMMLRPATVGIANKEELADAKSRALIHPGSDSSKAPSCWPVPSRYVT